MELLAWPSLTPEEEEKVRALFQHLTICELTQPIRRRAVALRKEHHLKLPDAVVGATAMEFGVELWTNDRSLAKIPGLNCRAVALVTV